MCRYDGDDYDWTVEVEDNNALADAQLICEDCGRLIPAGERHTQFVAVPTELDADQYIFAIQYEPRRYTSPNGYLTESFDYTKPFVKIEEDDSDVWEALGFTVFEEEDPEHVQPTEYHISCAQCRAAAKWLTAICRQHTVMVTREDLAEHAREYTAQQLGPDFLLLNELCQRQWRREGRVVSPQYVGIITSLAINFAKASGMAEMARV